MNNDQFGMPKHYHVRSGWREMYSFSTLLVNCWPLSRLREALRRFQDAGRGARAPLHPMHMVGKTVGQVGN